MWGVDTIPTSVRWMVGEIRSISVSSSVTFTDVSAIMSDSAIAENGNELSEMQRVTL